MHIVTTQSGSENRIQKISKISREIVGVVEDYWDKALKHSWGALIREKLGERSLGIFGDYKEKGNGWSKIENLAKEIIIEKKYSILTGKGIFYSHENGVIFNEFVFGPSPELVSYKKYSEWLVSLIPKAIILLGPLSSTVEDEEKEANRLKIPTCGVAVVDKISEITDNCSRLEIIADKHSFCIDGIGICEKGKFCPFFAKGLPAGRIDMYCRSDNMSLLAVSQQQNILAGLKYTSFI